MVEKINGIWRLTFLYKTKVQRNVIGYKKFAFPASPRYLFNSLKDLLGLKKSESKLTNEKAIIDFHDKIYDSNHRILAVGAGSGISLIYNCKKHRNHPFVVIEASEQQIALTKFNADLNSINEQQYRLIHGYAGNNNRAYGDISHRSFEKIDINKLDFDVLELDCEGCEIEILSGLENKPKYIIVEMHPTFLQTNFDSFLTLVSQKGYKLIDSKTIVGKTIPLKKLENHFDLDKINNKQNQGYDLEEIFPVLLLESI